MYKFFVNPENITDTTIEIIGSDVNHIKNVLRMKQDENVLISDGMGNEYLCKISGINNEKVETEIIEEKKAETELPAKIYLFQGLPKSDKMELIIQKAVELGVYEIIPVATKRAVVKLNEKKAEAMVMRWNLISKSAAKQSKRAVIPTVKNVMDFEQALRYAKDMDAVIIPYEEAQGMERTRAIISEVSNCKSIAVFIGPEGGFEESEIKRAEETGAKPITLGKRILRTETAGIMVLSVLAYHMEDNT